jgi:hypothetical protein
MAGTRNQNKLLQQGKQRNKIKHTKKENDKEKRRDELNEANRKSVYMHENDCTSLSPI